MLKQTWLAPFVFAAVILGIYLYGPEERREQIQKRIRTDLNFYLSSDLVLVAAALLDMVFLWRARWADWTVWILLAVLLGVGVRRVMAEPPPPPPSAFDEPEA